MKTILKKKLSKRTKLPYFQNFISRTFLDSVSLEKNLVDSLHFYAPLLGASLISSSIPWLAKGDHRVKPDEASWPRWAKAAATSWWMGVFSLVWMGGEENLRPVGDEVAGVATPLQGQYGISHLF